MEFSMYSQRCVNAASVAAYAACDVLRLDATPYLAQSWSVTDTGCPRPGNSSQCSRCCPQSTAMLHPVVKTQPDMYTSIRHAASWKRVHTGSRRQLPSLIAEHITFVCQRQTHRAPVVSEQIGHHNEQNQVWCPASQQPKSKVP